MHTTASVLSRAAALWCHRQIVAPPSSLCTRSHEASLCGWFVPVYVCACRLVDAEAAYDEIDILGTIAREEEAAGFDCHVVRIVDHFMHRGPHGLRTSLRSVAAPC